MNPKTQFGKFRIRWLLSLASIAMVIGIIVIGQWFLRDFQRFTSMPLSVVSSDATFTVDDNASFRDIVLKIRREQISRKAPFYWHVLATEMGVKDSIYVGEYDLTAGITPRLLLQKIMNGDVKKHQFVIINGWTLAQLRDALMREDGLRHRLGSHSDAEIARLINIPDIQLEGWFLPQAYVWEMGESDIDILRRAYMAMKQSLDALWKTRQAGLPLANQREALIVASIIEASSSIVDSQTSDSSAAYDSAPIELQTAQANIYRAAGGGENTLPRTEVELPKYPVVFPGNAALMATLHPALDDWLYWVPTKADPSRLEYSPVFLALLDVAQEHMEKKNQQ